MKTLVLLLLLTVPALSLVRAADDASYKPESRTSFEVFTSKVLKIYSFQDGDLTYAAYVVMWKDHEVVVTPMMGSHNDKPVAVGDTVRCQMVQNLYHVGGPGSAKTRVTFTLFGGGSSDPAEEARRLDAIRAEIEHRRAERASGTPLEKSP